MFFYTLFTVAHIVIYLVVSLRQVLITKSQVRVRQLSTVVQICQVGYDYEKLSPYSKYPVGSLCQILILKSLVHVGRYLRVLSWISLAKSQHKCDFFISRETGTSVPKVQNQAGVNITQRPRVLLQLFTLLVPGVSSVGTSAQLPNIRRCGTKHTPHCKLGPATLIM